MTTVLTRVISVQCTYSWSPTFRNSKVNSRDAGMVFESEHDFKRSANPECQRQLVQENKGFAVVLREMARRPGVVMMYQCWAQWNWESRP